jgi:hypothetical protein
MLLIISHHFLGDDEPLALIISPAICSALLLLLREGQAAGEQDFSDIHRIPYQYSSSSTVHYFVALDNKPLRSPTGSFQGRQPFQLLLNPI